MQPLERLPLGLVLVCVLREALLVRRVTLIVALDLSERVLEDGGAPVALSSRVSFAVLGAVRVEADS